MALADQRDELPLTFEGGGLWQMRQDLSERKRLANREIKKYMGTLIRPHTAPKLMRDQAKAAIFNSQQAVTESRTFWLNAAATEAEIWDGKTEAPSFWQMIQAAQQQLALGVPGKNIWNMSLQVLSRPPQSIHNCTAPSLDSSKIPIDFEVSKHKFLITHRCEDKERVKDLHLELRSDAIMLIVRNASHVKGLTTALLRRYKKHLAKKVELFNKNHLRKKRKFKDVADSNSSDNLAIRSLQEVVRVLDSVDAGVSASKITKENKPGDAETVLLGLGKNKPGDAETMLLGPKFGACHDKKCSELHLSQDRGLEYTDNPEDNAYTFKLESSCNVRSHPNIPFSENDGTIDFFNTKLSPKLVRFVKISIGVGANKYTITLQHFHGMSTSVVYPFIAMPVANERDDMTDFRERDYEVMCLPTYAIPGTLDEVEAMGQVLRAIKHPAVKPRIFPFPDDVKNNLLLGAPLFPKSRVYYSAENKESGAGSVYFACISGMIVGVQISAPSIFQLWTDNVNPLVPYPLDPYRGMPRNKGPHKIKIRSASIYAPGSTSISNSIGSAMESLPLQPRRLASRPSPAPWTSPAVDMELLMASVSDIKRSLNELRISTD